MAFVVNLIKKSKLFKALLYKTSHKSTNDSVFDDIIDYENTVIMGIYLKNSNEYYLGRFRYREEKGLDSFIVLDLYKRIDKTTGDINYDADKTDGKALVMISLRNVEAIHILKK